MYSGAKHGLLLAALLVSMLLLNSCENDLAKIKEISAQQSTSAVDSTTNVDVIYSDSAKVKLHMTAPLLLQHEDIKHKEKSYDEMPHGIKIIFYDTTRKETENIVADMAISHTQSQIIEFHRNVVVTNVEGETFRSDELIWDQVKKIMYSNKPVEITSAGGNVTRGDGFTSDDRLTHPVFGHMTGVYYVTEKQEN